jgi:hypothetical protein
MSLFTGVSAAVNWLAFISEARLCQSVLLTMPVRLTDGDVDDVDDISYPPSLLKMQVICRRFANLPRITRPRPYELLLPPFL